MRSIFRHIRVHEDMPDHPKVEPLSDSAFRLLISSWCWCRKYGTDGLMPIAVWSRRKTAKVRAELVSAGLVHEDRDGIRVHDFLDWQASTSEMEAKREQRRSAGQAGGIARAKRLATQTASESPSETQPEVEVDREEEKKTASSSARAKRGTQAPDIFPITDAMKAWGQAHAFLVRDPEAETRQFLDHHRAKGSVFKDWTAAWRTWMANAQKYALQRGEKRPAERDPSKAWLENM